MNSQDEDLARTQRHVVVLTGAGISAEAGLATFRDAGGLWEGQRPEEIATPEAWARDPGRVWRFYQQRRAGLLEVEPTVAHLALAEFEQAAAAAGIGFDLISQNVDDLHARAGSQPISMHGQLFELECERCGSRVVDREHVDPAQFVACKTCGFERLRPAVVWFGEVPRHLDRIEQAVLGATEFVCCGTSGAVYPAAGLVAAARGRGARCWMQALEPPDNQDPGDRFVPGKATETLPAILEELLR